MLMGLFATSVVVTAAQDWRKLGQKDVDFRVDHDTFGVGRGKGEFRQLKIEVSKAPVHFNRVVVTFGNGRKQELEFRDFIQPGGKTRAIDLEGNERFIKQVDFWYETESLGRKKSKVTLYGRR